MTQPDESRALRRWAAIARISAVELAACDWDLGWIRPLGTVIDRRVRVP